jgi:arylsulfatase A-like enzyme
MKKILNFITLVVLSLFTFSTHAANAPRPNIVFVLVDDLRWDALSCTGSKIAKTPNIDRIAKDGALFKNFFVTLPLCSPSRGSFLTGQYAHKNAIIDNTDRAAQSHKLVTFPKLLHDVGYETAYVGKLHMGNDDSPRPGFDRWVSFKGQGVYQDPMINFDGKAEKVPGYMTDILNSNAVAFVNKEHTKPFVLYLAHKAVHGPFTPAERHKDLYADAKISPPPSVADSLEGKPALTRDVETVPQKKQKKTATQSNFKAEKKFPPGTMLQQLRALASIDEGVGQIFAALEKTKQLDNTIFIFSSDNGYFWAEHGLGDKRWAYEESIRDPLLVRYPKLVKAGTKIDEIVLNIDLAPTLLELGGAKIPKDVQGESFLPLLKGERVTWRKSGLFEYF